MQVRPKRACGRKIHGRGIRGVVPARGLGRFKNN